MPGEPFDIDVALERVHTAIAPFPKAAMFALFERGYTSLFAQLVGCMLSIRTRDEVVLPVALRLLGKAPDAAAMAQLEPAEIESLIASVTFAGQKAQRLRALAQRCLVEYGGEPPCEAAALMAFSGIGPKCAHLALGIACGLPLISVDIHVHRIVNRWGYVRTAEPEQTLTALEQRLPREHWIAINALLVPFGKHICTGRLPHCSSCPLRAMCPRVGVAKAR